MKTPKRKKTSVLKRTLSSLGETYRFAPNAGKLCVYTFREGKSKTVGICGDPKGLRYLAKLLNDVADIDQSKVLDNNCLQDVGVHYHLYNSSGRIHPKSENVLVGRADAKSGGIWFELLS